MTYDSEDDLFNEEFDFVDEDELDSELEDSVVEDDAKDDIAEDVVEVEVDKKPTPNKRSRPAKARTRKPREDKARVKSRSPKATKSKTPQVKQDDAVNGTTAKTDASQPADDKAEETVAPEPVGPPTDHVVHLYEFGNFTRTIPRGFTSEEAEAFATEYNRTSKTYGRKAVAAGKDEEYAISVSR